jgi:hypothetical protein
MSTLPAANDARDRNSPNTTKNTVRFCMPEKDDDSKPAHDGQHALSANPTQQPTFEAFVSPQVLAMPWSALPAFSLADTVAVSFGDCALDDDVLGTVIDPVTATDDKE